MISPLQKQSTPCMYTDVYTVLNQAGRGTEVYSKPVKQLGSSNKAVGEMNSSFFKKCVFSFFKIYYSGHLLFCKYIMNFLRLSTVKVESSKTVGKSITNH